MTSILKKQQKIVSDLPKNVRHLGFNIREVRVGVARISNAGSGTSKTPQNYTGTIFELLYPKVAEEISEIVVKRSDQ
ncbi:12545_t:CDS:2 [Acaulospora morrowiae]|uniref:12545_t:CDS:1 n=1 Tax=Acaulospora morrowiae TaxID=94023 RepID=A0A9N9FVI0_9GLOM|nr:12545_t:CDS:2 [Acaulospora morrowiae]